MATPRPATPRLVGAAHAFRALAASDALEGSWGAEWVGREDSEVGSGGLGEV